MIDASLDSTTPQANLNTQNQLNSDVPVTVPRNHSSTGTALLHPEALRQISHVETHPVVLQAIRFLSRNRHVPL
jgi:hypothetical protein